jgi:FkbM family methyltransferase
MDIFEIEALVNYRGTVTASCCGIKMVFNMVMPHERRYFIRLLCECRYPQADIDTLIFKNIIHKGDRVLDAGANIGITAIEALSFGAEKVICIEPEPSLAERLREIAHPNCVIKECALGSARGKSVLFLSASHNQGHTIKQETIDMFPQIFGSSTQSVDVDTIQNILQGERFDVWKLDIEGAEVDAIKGLGHNYEAILPRVVVAEIYRNNFDEMIGLLGKHFNVYRAVIRRSDYSLQYLPVVPYDLSDDYHVTSPMYVFKNKYYTEQNES